MRLGLGLRLGAVRGRSTLALLLAGAALAPIARRWADADTWNDSLTWSDLAWRS